MVMGGAYRCMRGPPAPIAASVSTERAGTQGAPAVIARRGAAAGGSISGAVRPRTTSASRVLGEQQARATAGPGRGGLLGDVEVRDPAPIVGEDNQDAEHTQSRGGHGEEVDRDQALDMVRDERA